MYVTIDLSADARHERAMIALHAQTAIHELQELLEYIKEAEKVHPDWHQKVATVDIKRLNTAIKVYNSTLEMAKEYGYTRENLPEIEE